MIYGDSPSVCAFCSSRMPGRCAGAAREEPSAASCRRLLVAMQPYYCDASSVSRGKRLPNVSDSSDGEGKDGIASYTSVG